MEPALPFSFERIFEIAGRLEPARVWKWYRPEGRSPRRRIKRIASATVRAGAVPKASCPPRTPGLIIIYLAVGISRFDRRAISADTRQALYLLLPGYRRLRCQSKNHRGAQDFEFHRWGSFILLRSLWLMQLPLDPNFTCPELRLASTCRVQGYLG